jgi:hypothetical protein
MNKAKFNEQDVLDQVTVIRIESQADIDRFNELIRQEHYLKNSRVAGKVIRHVGVYNGEWMALMCWSASAYHLKARDEWIGWTDDQRRRRLGLIAANSRFLLRVKPSEVPNLATRVMKQSLQRLDTDWREVHGHGLLMVETFVDPTFYQGTCYKAGNWSELGYTAGYGRKGRDYYEEHEQPKRLFVKALRKDAAKQLAADELPQVYAAGEVEPKPLCRFNVPELGSLFDLFNTMSDPRRKAGRRYPLACILSICACAILTGGRDYQAIYDFALGLTKQQRRRLRCWRNPHTKRFEVPSKTTFWNVLTAIDPVELDERLGLWLSKLSGAETEALSIDGKTVKGAWTSEDRQLHLFAAFAHDSSVVYSQCAVDEKSNEITHVDTLLDSVELDGKIVTADALNTQRRTARYLVQERGADYVFTIKENQPNLLKKAQQLLPDSLFFPEETTVDPGPRPGGKSSGGPLRNPS